MKKLKTVNALLVIGVFTTTSMVSAPFTQAQSIDQQIKALEAERSQDQANAGLLSGQAQDIQGQISDLQTQIASIQAQMNSNAAKQNELTSQIESAQTKLEEQKDLLSANVRAMYIEGDISPLEVIASSKNLGDYVDRQEYRDRIKDSVTSLIDEIERLKKQLDEQRQEIVRVLSEQKSLRGNLATKEGEANQKLAQTNQNKAEFDKAVSSKTSQIASLRAQQLAANRRAFGGGGSQIINSGNSGGGYPDKWASAPIDSLVDSWGLYNRECVSYTAWKVYQSGKRMPYFGGRGNANQWPSTARSFGIGTGSEPRAQSVAVSYAGPYGHTMWVEEVLGGGKIRISEYNFNVDGRYSERIISGAGLTYVYF